MKKSDKRYAIAQDKANKIRIDAITGRYELKDLSKKYHVKENTIWTYLQNRCFPSELGVISLLEYSKPYKVYLAHLLCKLGYTLADLDAYSGTKLSQRYKCMKLTRPLPNEIQCLLVNSIHADDGYFLTNTRRYTVRFIEKDKDKVLFITETNTNPVSKSKLRNNLEIIDDD